MVSLKNRSFKEQLKSTIRSLHKSSSLSLADLREGGEVGLKFISGTYGSFSIEKEYDYPIHIDKIVDNRNHHSVYDRGWTLDYTQLIEDYYERMYKPIWGMHGTLDLEEYGKVWVAKVLKKIEPPSLD